MRRPRPPRTRLLPATLPLACLLPVLLASAPLAAQQVYKWKDAAGVTHFTSEPPPDRPYETREIDRHQAVPAATGAETGSDAPAAPARKGEDPACTSARGRLALLEGNTQLMADSDGDGKPDKPLADADREKQRALAAAIIAVKCDGAAPAQDAAPAQAGEPEEQ